MLTRRIYFFAALSILGFCSVAGASDIHAHPRYDKATKVLADARKDCKAVRTISLEAQGVVAVDCLSQDNKSSVRYRIAPNHTGVPRVTFLSRAALAREEASGFAGQDEQVNQYATAIVRDYRYECAKVVRVTTQADGSLVAVCTPEYGRDSISYRLVETPGAHMNTRVTPIE